MADTLPIISSNPATWSKLEVTFPRWHYEPRESDLIVGSISDTAGSSTAETQNDTAFSSTSLPGIVSRTLRNLEDAASGLEAPQYMELRHDSRIPFKFQRGTYYLGIPENGGFPISLEKNASTSTEASNASQTKKRGSIPTMVAYDQEVPRNGRSNMAIPSTERLFHRLSIRAFNLQNEDALCRLVEIAKKRLRVYREPVRFAEDYGLLLPTYVRDLHPSEGEFGRKHYHAFGKFEFIKLETAQPHGRSSRT